MEDSLDRPQASGLAACFIFSSSLFSALVSLFVRSESFTRRLAYVRHDKGQSCSMEMWQVRSRVGAITSVKGHAAVFPTPLSDISLSPLHLFLSHSCVLKLQRNWKLLLLLFLPEQKKKKTRRCFFVARRCWILESDSLFSVAAALRRLLRL